MMEEEGRFDQLKPHIPSAVPYLSPLSPHLLHDLTHTHTTQWSTSVYAD